jgi:hypothetical protein
MAKKPLTPKEKELNDRLTIRLDDEAKANILAVQSALADPVRGKLTVTDAIYSALRIARKNINVASKS